VACSGNKMSRNSFQRRPLGFTRALPIETNLRATAIDKRHWRLERQPFREPEVFHSSCSLPRIALYFEQTTESARVQTRLLSSVSAKRSLLKSAS
jgi:hypothetical protein